MHFGSLKRMMRIRGEGTEVSLGRGRLTYAGNRRARPHEDTQVRDAVVEFLELLRERIKPLTRPIHKDGASRIGPHLSPGLQFRHCGRLLFSPLPL